MRIRNVSVYLLLFGVSIFILTLIEIGFIIFPIQVINDLWIYNFSKLLSERAILPILSIVLILGASVLIKPESKRYKILNYEKGIGLICFLSGTILLSLAFLLVFKINSVELNMNNYIKQSSEQAKQQILSHKASSPNYDQLLNNIDNEFFYKVNSAKLNIIKSNIKIILNLVLYGCGYLFIAITLFSFSIRASFSKFILNIKKKILYDKYTN